MINEETKEIYSITPSVNMLDNVTIGDTITVILSKDSKAINIKETEEYYELQEVVFE